MLQIALLLLMVESTLVYDVSATEIDTICPQKPVQCVECSSDLDRHCADPFNKTLINKKGHQISSELCDGFCVKWVRKPLPGKIGSTHYRRTCSKRINLNMQINMVCIHESRSGAGHLCLCNRDSCNSAPTLQPAISHFTLILLILLTTFLPRVVSIGFLNF